MAETIKQRRARKRRERAARLEYYRERGRLWASKNREALREKSKRWYAENKDYWKNRSRNEPRFRLMLRLRTRVFLSLKRNLAGMASKSETTKQLLGCSVDDLKSHLEKSFRDGMAWENYGPVWHVDHIKPIALFDLRDKAQRQACFHYTNLQPLLAQENRKKGMRFNEDKIQASYYEEAAVLSQVDGTS